MSPNVKDDEPVEAERPRSRLAELQGGGSRGGDCGSAADRPPLWLDRQRFQRARELFKKHFFSIFFCHLSGLMLIVHLPNMTETLLSTGYSSSVVSLFRRYLSTLVHIRRWYEGDIWNPEDSAHQSITLVRSMHKRVADRLNGETTPALDSREAPTCQSSHSGCPVMSQSGESCLTSSQSDRPARKDRVAVSQYDMALTQFAFVGLLLMNSKSIGLHCSREDLESLVHFWRGVGYMLGVEDKYNLCSGGLDETIALCEDIAELELKPALMAASKDSSSMSRGIIQAMNSFIVFLSWEAMARLWFERFGLLVKFPMGLYEKVGYWLMRFTFEWLLRWQFFHSFFNFLLRIAIQQAFESKEYFEGYLKRRYKVTNI